MYKGEEIDRPLSEAIRGRVSRETDRAPDDRGGDRRGERDDHAGEGQGDREARARQDHRPQPDDLPGPAGRLPAVLRHGPGHRGAGRGRHGRRHHRRPVDRRAGHAADHADVPHRRRGQPCRRSSRASTRPRRAGSFSSSASTSSPTNRGRTSPWPANRRDRHPRAARTDRSSSGTGAQRGRAVRRPKARRSTPGHVARQVGPALAADHLRGERARCSYEDIKEGDTLRKEKRRVDRRRAADDHGAQGRPAPADHGRRTIAGRPDRRTSSPSGPTWR